MPVYEPFALPAAPTYAQDSAAAASLEPEVSNDITISSPTGTLNNSLLPTISVSQASTAGSTSGGQTGDISASVANGLVEYTGDSQISLGWFANVGTQTSADNIASTPGDYANALASVVTGGYQPSLQSLVPLQFNAADVATAFAEVAAPPTSSALPYGNLADDSLDSKSDEYIDPLLLDLTGNGIQVSNWINNTVYFKTNLNAALPGTGMLVFDP
jgi:hypothetical protein